MQTGLILSPKFSYPIIFPILAVVVIQNMGHTQMYAHCTTLDQYLVTPISVFIVYFIELVLNTYWPVQITD